MPNCLVYCFEVITYCRYQISSEGTSVGSNLQYDSFCNAKDLLKSFPCNQEEHLRDHLVIEGSFVSTATSQALPTLNSLWSSAQRTLNKNIFNFTVKYINNTLPTKKNLCKWGLSPTSDCSLCLKPESLLHVVARCTTYLNHGRFTWHHNSMLQFIAKSLKSILDSVLYVDFPGYVTPRVQKKSRLHGCEPEEGFLNLCQF